MKNIKISNKLVSLTLFTYLLVLIVFFIFRFILFTIERNKIENADLYEITSSFLIGLRFDCVIIGYIFIFPYFILSLSLYYAPLFKIIKVFVFWLISLLFSLSFIVCAADIPYFSQFFSRFSISAFEWFDNPFFVFKMIIEEPKYFVYIIPLVIIIYLFIKIYRKIYNFQLDKEIQGSKIIHIILNFLVLVFIFIGIRGRIEKKSPIRVGTAYFCNDPFINQLGLNPNFTLIRSYIDSRKEENKEIQLMNSSEALSIVRKQLKINKDSKYSPIAREVKFNSTKFKNQNIVLIIMESMSAAKMKRHGNNQNLTPFLDSISQKSAYFENTYTAGIHTYNGIFSTLFSFPALFRKHPMKDISMPKYYGIASVLKKHNYSTTYFTTHDGQFDNVEGFLKANDFETVVSVKDYPSHEVKTTLGVPDDYMFKFSMPILNKLAKKNQPFLSVFMTASDHGPYYIPPYFHPKTKDIKTKIVEYSDYSLKEFFKAAQKQIWYKNTLFVLIADHGAPLRNSYEIPLDYVHSPLVFFHPKGIVSPKIYQKIASQIDVFPTIMGILKLDFLNNTLGIDLLNDSRTYSIINGDDKFGVIDKDWLLIINQDKRIGLYNHKKKDLKNYAMKYEHIANKMKNYGTANLQTYQYLLKSNKVKVK